MYPRNNHWERLSERLLRDKHDFQIAWPSNLWIHSLQRWSAIILACKTSICYDTEEKNVGHMALPEHSGHLSPSQFVTDT